MSGGDCMYTFGQDDFFASSSAYIAEVVRGERAMTTIDPVYE